MVSVFSLLECLNATTCNLKSRALLSLLLPFAARAKPILLTEDFIAIELIENASQLAKAV